MEHPRHQSRLDLDQACRVQRTAPHCHRGTEIGWGRRCREPRPWDRRMDSVPGYEHQGSFGHCGTWGLHGAHIHGHLRGEPAHGGRPRTCNHSSCIEPRRSRCPSTRRNVRFFAPRDGHGCGIVRRNARSAPHHGFGVPASRRVGGTLSEPQGRCPAVRPGARRGRVPASSRTLPDGRGDERHAHGRRRHGAGGDRFREHTVGQSFGQAASL